MPITTQERIRQMSAEGNSHREIAEKLGISRKTVSTYLKKEDFSPAPPTKSGGRSR